MIVAPGGNESPAEANGFRQILGVTFFGGPAQEAFAKIRGGGLLVAPAAPALLKLSKDPGYREALLNANLCITDSGFMVTVWNGSHWDKLHRLSGLEYLRFILDEPEVRREGNTFWVMSSEASSVHHLAWLETRGIKVPASHVYIAPEYRGSFQDQALRERLRNLRPAHVIVTLGGGSQEPLGHFLNQSLAHPPAIHCIGGAIGFLSGDQVKIPMWADRTRVGCLFRIASDPHGYFPRYWKAGKLLPLLLQYGSELPPMMARPD